jgi:tetratricopeptide (TPR) repeat protein
MYFHFRNYKQKTFALAFCLFASIAVLAQNAETYFNDGLTKETAEDYKEAIKLFDTAIALNKDFAEAWADRGNCKNELSLYKDAISDYDQSIQIDPSQTDVWFNRGVAKYNSGDLKGSIADLTHLLQLDPHDSTAYHMRGFAYQDLGNFDSACADFQRAVNLGLEEAKADLEKCKNSNNSGNAVILDTSNGQVKLLAQGPFMQNLQSRTFAIIFIIRLGDNPGSDTLHISYSSKFHLDPSAAIRMELKNGKKISPVAVLTDSNETDSKTTTIMGVFNLNDKQHLLESDLKTIEIISGKMNYKYDIREEYAAGMKTLVKSDPILP